MAKDDYLLQLGMSDTRFGTCKGKTAKGKPCRHTSVLENGYCLSHGGQTDRKAQVERAKEKVLRQFARQKKKWNRTSKQDLAGSYPTAQDFVSPRKKTAHPAKALQSSKPSLPVSGDAPTTDATANKPEPRQRKASSEPTVTSQAPRPKRAGRKHLQHSPDQDGSPKKNGKQKNKKPSLNAALMQSAESTLHASSGQRTNQTISANPIKTERDEGVGDKGEEHRARAGVDSCVQDEIPSTYSRGNRGDPWRVVGTDSKGRPVVEIPPWSPWSVPRGVYDPRATDWQTQTCPPRRYVEPRVFDD